MTTAVPEAAARLCDAIALASRGLVEREALVELVALAAVAGEHVLVIGPPGTAKSEAVRRASRALGGQYFEYLLGRFTEPGELFGPVDLRRLREGVIEVETAGMLPEAEVAFLDEVFLGSTAILNTLLTILNERTFRRGSTRRACPLRVCVGASNALPDDDALAPFADRFLVRAFLDPVADARLEDLLAGGWNLSASATTPIAAASMDDVDTLAVAARSLDLGPVRPALAHAIRLLRRAQVNLSDRRAVRVQRLVAAAAVLAGRTVATEEDLWPLLTAVPTREEQATARDALRDVLARSRNGALRAAAEDASAGPLARARRIATDADALLARGPDASAIELAGDPQVHPPDPREAFRLRVEGILREIDAGFAPGSVPAELVAVRPRLVAALATWA
ncbi:MAG: AAA family ATPase [Myxococcales bacterium]|nr:AAA family ATPase [Myxococcales bacterium]